MENTSSAGKRTRQCENTFEQQPEKRHRAQHHHPDAADDRVGLVQQFPDPEDDAATRNARVDVVALHGLRAQSPKTWIAWKDGKTSKSGKVNWLRDPEMLPSVVPDARILTYDWNASYTEGASTDRFLGHANVLLRRLQLNRRDNKRSGRPLVFIASCFGGLLLARALTRAAHQEPSCEYHQIFRLTSGIIFLGTPFRGSWDEGYYIAKYRYSSRQDKGLEGSEELIQYLRSDGRQDAKRGPSPLDDMVQQFAEVIRPDKYGSRVVFFYETQATELKPHLKDLQANPMEIDPSRHEVVVPQSSACLDGFKRFGLDVKHNLLHKHALPDGDAFKQIANQVKDLVEQAVQPTPLEASDDWIRNTHYTDNHLGIERLLGDPLPMEQCYINLAIVWQPRAYAQDPASSSDGQAPDAYPFSLTTRMKVETPEQNLQVDLPTLFDPRKMPDDQTVDKPRRVLIRGRAGVGKTTLCKKIVHDCLHHSMWSTLFTRVLWLPLRKLKQLQSGSCNLGHVFSHYYFQGCHDGDTRSKRFWEDLEASKYCDTLFILDGLDEVSELLDTEHTGHHVLQDLFKMPNIVVTTRPHTTSPYAFPEPDMELETIGFLPDQVQAYLQRVVQDSGTVREIQQFLQKNWLFQSLVRIPIQLDALSSLWDKDFGATDTLKTMTGVYQAIVQRLWKKDVIRLGRMSGRSAARAGQKEIEARLAREKKMIESLAFSGMYNDVVELQTQYRDAILDMIESLPEETTLDELLGDISFLRTSDPLAPLSKRSYHFLHLTFQEFFAAQYFVRQWRTKSEVEYWDFRENKRKTIDPVQFLQRHKYTGRYDIVWRFVTGLVEDERKEIFFTELQKEPIDLLGPTHQRLVMHCLTEVGEDPALRCRLEDRLAQWLLYECDLAGKATLARESEYPDTSLKAALEKGSREQRLLILKAINVPSRYLSAAAVEAIVNLLRDADDSVRSAAASALGNQSSLSPAAVGNIISLLQNADSSVQYAAASAFKNQSNLSLAAIEAIIVLSRDANSFVRYAAASALRNQPSLSSAAVKAIVDLSRDPVISVRSAAASALGNQSSLSPAAAEALDDLSRDADISVQSAAAIALRNQSSLSPTAMENIDNLSPNADVSVRSAAARALGNQSSLSPAAVDALVDLSRDADISVRSATAHALGNQSSLSPAAVKVIVDLSQDADDSVRSAAARALGNQLSLSPAAVKDIISLLQNADSSVRYAAARALGNQSSLSPAAVKDIISLLQNTNNSVRSAAAYALGNQSSLSPAAVDALVDLSRDADISVRSATAHALGNQSSLSPAAVKVIVDLSQNADVSVRSAAARALGNQLSLSPAAVKDIISLLQNADSSVRYAAARALGNQSSLSPAAVKDIVDLSRNTNNSVRSAAASVFKNQSSLSPAAVKVIIDLSQDADVSVRSAAAYALGNQSSLSPAAVDAIVELSRDADNSVRSAAARAVGSNSALIDNLFIPCGALQENEDLKSYQSSRVSDVFKCLYGSLLCRAFTEEFCLYSAGNTGSYTIHKPTTIEKAGWKAGKWSQLSDVLQASRQLWNPNGYDLWSCNEHN